MAHSLSAKKRIRQNIKRRARNRWRKDQIKQAVREFTDAVRAGDKKTATETLRVCYKKLDSVSAKGAIHKNTAARKKARLAQAMNKALG
ncbi:MAG: 30S ribosomal protein S20 [Phycisphaerae bacterium]|nr:30S ribosomal protein S20 [Phycisphaerae bacterium]